MPDLEISQHTGRSTPQTARLYYLDWLRVIAILIVFLFHAVHPFDFTGWHVKNAEKSIELTVVLVFLSLWGMAFFFLVAGAGSWFALRSRTPSQYTSERFKRLFVPFVCGSILFSPIILLCEWGNKMILGEWTGTLQEYTAGVYEYYLDLGLNPRWLGIGYHLWFLGFLFAFALVTLPLFQWLKGDSGRRLVSRLAGWCEHRGGLLVGILPLILVQLILRPSTPKEHDWADFVFQMSFFVLGFLLFADERFTRAVRRDWWLLFTLGTLLVLGLLALFAMGFPIMTWGENPRLPQFFLIWSLIPIIAFCYSLTMLYVGMRWLDFTNGWLRYAQQAVLPFFVVHQPVILVIAFFVVQWNAGIAIKALFEVPASFFVSVALYEFAIKRIGPLRLVFGVKARPRAGDNPASAGLLEGADQTRPLPLAGK